MLGTELGFPKSPLPVLPPHLEFIGEENGSARLLLDGRFTPDSKADVNELNAEVPMEDEDRDKDPVQVELGDGFALDKHDCPNNELKVEKVPLEDEDCAKVSVTDEERTGYGSDGSNRPNAEDVPAKSEDKAEDPVQVALDDGFALDGHVG